MAKKITPKISVNKLGEYIKSSPHRRREIVRNQKYPENYVVTRYSIARKAIIDYFVNNKGNKKDIETSIKNLILRTHRSPFQKTDNELSIKALEIFSHSNLPDLGEFETSKFGHDLNSLSIEGVEISIQPNILITGSIRGKEFVGAIKIHISKTNPLRLDSGKYVSTLIHKYLEITYDKKVRPEFCISMDIFTGEYFVAPKSFKMLRKDIEAACNEIRLLWTDL